MLKQGSVDQVRHQQIQRATSHIVIAMAFYPRGLKKELADEYRGDLAPARDLFKEWKEFEKAAGHDEAFKLSRYEDRFDLSPTALFHLKTFSELAKEKDVYLICQCGIGERCHREMLLIAAHQKYDAPIDKVFHDYPVWKSRISGLNDKLTWGTLAGR
jgi:uncharacterized protein YeaO (DUF488 family)